MAKDFAENSETSKSEADTAVFARYLERLLALVKQKMSQRLATRIDPEDVVQSAYRSFFLGLREGRLVAETSGDIWHLLVEITLHKLYRQAAFHSAKKRAMQVEVHGNETSFPAAHCQPPPEAAVILADELEQLFATLKPRERQIFELRTQGLELSEIAPTVGCSARTVRRTLDEIKDQLRQRFSESFPQETRRRGNVAKRNSQLQRGQAFPANDSNRLDFRDYFLREHIGSGSSAKVYRATKLSTGEMVAVKFLRKSWLNNRRAVARFAQEATILTTLNHPHIAHLDGWGRTPNGGYFLALQFAEMGDLQARYGHRNASRATAIKFVRQIASAVRHAHERQVMHGDLKPGNILLLSEEHVLVADFGLANRMADDSAQSAIGGTPAFLAPELIVPPHALSVATDVFGIGAIFYFLLTGVSPYRGNTAAEILEDVISNRELGFANESRGAIPAEIVAFCNRCLARDLGRRYQNVEELEADLARLES